MLFTQIIMRNKGKPDKGRGHQGSIAIVEPINQIMNLSKENLN